MKTNKWNICLVCLKESRTLKDIFDEQNGKTEDKFELAKKISLCGGIELDERSNLPNKICAKCLLRLKVSWKFRLQCQLAKKQLLQLMSAMHAEEIKTVAEPPTQPDVLLLKPKTENACDQLLVFNEMPAGAKEQKMEDYDLEFDVLQNGEPEYLNESCVDNEFLELNATERGVSISLTDDNCETYECIEMHVGSPHNDTAEKQSVKSFELQDEAGGKTPILRQLEQKTRRPSYLQETSKVETSTYSVTLTRAEDFDIEENSAKNVEISTPCQLIEIQLSCNASLDANNDDGYLDEALQPAIEEVKEENPPDDLPPQSTFRKTATNLSLSKRKRKQSQPPVEEKIKKENSFICCYCGNIYNQKAKLTVHLKIHTKDKKHECEICHKRFTQTPQLKRHMNTHTGNRPFRCQFCTASFADPSTCIKHERIHTKERPFKCSVCGKGFSYSHVLKVHERIHSGEKPYECSICQKRFSQNHHMRAHKRTHITFPFAGLENSEEQQQGNSSDEDQ